MSKPTASQCGWPVLASEEIAGAAQFQVECGDFEACSEVREFAEGQLGACGRFR